MKATSCAPKMVCIEPLPIPDDGVLKKVEQTKDAEMKKQNRGTVLLKGTDAGKDASGNDWFVPGDLVSFYRNAATPIRDEDGTEYVIVDTAHVLVKF